jgi:antitoxin component YwqK of YwqJK toxin-antitoxin module
VTKYFSLIACCLIILSGCSADKTPPDNSHKLSSVNIIDRNGITETITNNERLKKFEAVDFCSSQPYQKVLRVYGSDPQNNIKAVVTSYHPNGQLKQYLDVVNNRAFGFYREYFADGQLQLEANVIGGVADLSTAAENTWLYDGISKAWNEKGQLIAEILYCKGELEGMSTYYHANGTVWKKIPFHKNLISGIMEVYLENGQLLQTTEYTIGEKTGASIRYWPDQNISSNEMYKNGLLASGQYFDTSGQLVAEVEDGEGFRAVFGKDYVSEIQEIHEGVLEGEIRIFDKNGKLLRYYNVHNNLKHGELVEYWDKKTLSDKAVPKMAITYYEGKIQGHARTWYDNGVQESQREMSSNARNGLSTAWYRDGSLMLIEEYDHDKIKRGEYYKRGEKTPISEISQGNGTATLFDSEGHYIRKITYQNGRPLQE